MADVTVLSALAGGGLIGLGTAGLLLFTGRIAGISGIAAGALSERGTERAWRTAFLFGLILGAAIVIRGFAHAVEIHSVASVPGLILAGLLVGFGTRLGGGCTSGHGVCGIARLSPRSLVATVVFIAAAAVVVFVVRHVLGLPTWP